MAIRREEVRVTADVSNFVTRAATAGKAARSFAADLDAADTRLSNFVQTAMAVAPAFVPLTAAVVPAVAGLVTQLGFAVAGAGTAVLAFQGMGDALTALNEYHLDPTQKNLDAVHEAMRGMAPAAQEFALYLDTIRPSLDDLQDATQNGLFPGAQEGLEELMGRLPEVESILSTMAQTMGNLLAEGGENLAGSGWDEFFTYVDQTARPIMREMGETLGNLVQGTADLWMAVDPLSRGFSQAFLSMARDYREWAAALDGSEGLESFIEYLNDVGPQAWDTLGSISEALLTLAEAAAPVGSLVLPVLEVLAETITVIAGSDVGPVLVGTAAGIAAISRAMALYNAANGSAFGTMYSRVTSRAGTAAKGLRTDAAAFLDFGSGLDTFGRKAERVTTTNERMRRSFGRLATAGAGIGAFTLAMTDLDDQMGLSNTTMLGMMGLFAGPWGGALGAAAGATMDAAAANNDFADALERANDALEKTPEQLEQQQQLFGDLNDEYIAFKNSIEGDGFWDTFWKGFKPKSLKNSVEGIFGTSDIEEMYAEVLAIQDQVILNQQTWNALYDGINNRQGPTSVITDLDKLSAIARDAQPAMDALGITLQDLQEMDPPEFAAAADAIRDYINSHDSAAGRTRDVRDAVAGLDDELLTTASSASTLADALDALLGPTLNAEEATDAWKAGLAGLREELEGNRRTFAGYSQDALENREATRARAEEITTMLKARAEAGASSEEIARLLRESRRAFIEEGVAIGFSRDEMRARAKEIGLTPKLVRTIFKGEGLDTLADKVAELKRRYDLTPKQVNTVIDQINMGKSQDDIRDLLRQYDLTPEQIDTAIKLFGVAAAESQLNDVARARFVPIYTYHAGAGGKSVENVPSADGNLFDFYADGGIRRRLPRIGDQQPQLRPYRDPRGLVWSEAGSGPWEAFISGHPAKRTRSRSIADEVVSRLGGQVAWFADGGLVARVAASTQRLTPTPPPIPVAAAAGPSRVTVGLSDHDVQRIAAAVRAGSEAGTARGMTERGQALRTAMRTGVR